MISFQLTGLYLLLAKRVHNGQLLYFWQTMKIFRASVLSLEERCSNLSLQTILCYGCNDAMHIEVMQKEGNTSYHSKGVKICIFFIPMVVGHIFHSSYNTLSLT